MTEHEETPPLWTPEELRAFDAPRRVPPPETLSPPEEPADAVQPEESPADSPSVPSDPPAPAHAPRPPRREAFRALLRRLLPDDGGEW